MDEQWRKNHEEFVRNIVEVLTNRPKCEMLVMIDDGTQVEFYGSNSNLVWRLGVMDVVRLQVETEQRYRISLQLQRQDSERLEAEFRAAADVAKGSIH